jgi:hypothetical protein
MTATDDTIRVQLESKVCEYPQMIAALGDHLAGDGTVGALFPFLADARRNIRRNDWVKAVCGWVELDGTGLAYFIEATARSFRILGAAPFGDPIIRDIYVA